MTLRFEHTTLGQRVVFGSGNSTAALAAEARRLGATRVMTIASASQRDVATQVCRDVDVRHRFDRVAQHVPVEVAEPARARPPRRGIDAVSVGGGSTTGTGQGGRADHRAADHRGADHLCRIGGDQRVGPDRGGRKTTGVDDRVLPARSSTTRELTASLPARDVRGRGLNAMAHCVDSLWAPGPRPDHRRWPLEGIRALAAGLPAVAGGRPTAWPAAEQTLYGAYLAGGRVRVRPVRACTTRSATSSAARSTCRTRRPTRPCCLRAGVQRPRRAGRGGPDRGRVRRATRPGRAAGVARAPGCPAGPGGLRLHRGGHRRGRRGRPAAIPASQPAPGDRGEPDRACCGGSPARTRQSASDGAEGEAR